MISLIAILAYKGILLFLELTVFFLLLDFFLVVRDGLENFKYFY